MRPSACALLVLVLTAAAAPAAALDDGSPASAGSAASPRPREPAPSAPEEPVASTWLVYRRSGGLTGWSAEVRVGHDGSVTAQESNRPAEDGPRPPVTGEAVVRLRRLVDAALALPARQVRPDHRHLRDGVVRTLEVSGRSGDGGAKTIQLSDGYDLEPGDHALAQELEALVRPASGR